MKRTFLALFCGCLLGLGSLPARGASFEGQELVFAEHLITLGFPDYAEKILNRLLKDDPSLQAQATLMKVKILVGYRKFAEAEALIKTLPANDPQAQACWMAIASGYVQAKDLAAAGKIYNDFLDRQAAAGAEAAGTTNMVVLDAAYRVAQILEKTGDLDGAIKAYDRLLQLTGKNETTLLSKMQCAQANLYLKKARAATGKDQQLALESALKICKAVVWRGVDLYFCQAVIIMAQVDLLRNDTAAAKKKLADNWATFKKIDEFLRNQKEEDKIPLSLSPMAAGLFFLGTLDQSQGAAFLAQNKEKGIELLAQAFKELNAVVAGYSESEYAPEAAARAQSVREQLQGLGKTVEPVAAAQAPAGAAVPAAKAAAGAPTAQDAAVAAQMKAADSLFYSKTNYPQALAEYLRILNGNPDTTHSPRMLMNLARCYVYQKDDLMAKATARYLAERFALNPQAGAMLMQIGKACSEQQNLDMLAFMYDTFIDSFPKHDNVPAVLFSMAMIRKKKDDEAGAAKFIQRIIDEYPNDPSYLKAIDQAAWWRYKEKQFEPAAELFKKYLAEVRDEKLKPQAQFGLANCYLSLEKFDDALKEFRSVKPLLEKSVAEKDPALTAAVLKQRRDMLEQTCYLAVFCLSRLDKPPESVPAYRDEAIVLAGQFMKDYSNSAWAPKTMSMEGMMQLERGQVNMAVETFNQLAARYPSSPEGNNALVSLVQAALTVKKNDVARDAFEKMKANKQFYLSQGKESTFAYIGRVMFDARQYPSAIGAYQIVTNSATTNRALLENAYFYLGSAACESTNYAQAVSALSTLLTRYPQSGYFYDAKFLLGRSYRGLGQYQQVYDTLSDVATRATNIVLINKASMELSKTQVSQGLKKEALASLMRVTLLADVNNPELRPMVEEAFMESLALQKELKGRDDIIETCRQYLAKFPNGARAAEVGQILRAAELMPAEPSK